MSAMATPAPDAIVVFALIAVALGLFLSERFPPDVTALGLLVSLVLLEPWTHVDATDAIQGFANPATVTIIGMYILSEGIRRTGIVSRLGDRLASFGRGSERRLLGATMLTTGFGAGFVNNTPIVAVFIPMVTKLSAEANISPSKLLLPLSYAAMLGGTVTLIGTATNILVSDISRDLLGHPISMFEFTPLGVVVLLVGLAYLFTVGRWLIPARVEPQRSAFQAFEMERHLARVVVREESPLVGHEVEEVQHATEPGAEPFGDVWADVLEAEPSGLDLQVLQLVRDGDTTIALGSDVTVEPGDVLTVRGNRRAVNRFAERFGLRQLPREDVAESDIEVDTGRGRLVEVVLPDGSRLVGETVRDANLAAYHNAAVLAMRKGGETIREGLRDRTLNVGDALLLQVHERNLRYLVENGDVIVTQGVGHADPRREEPSPLDPKTPIAILIMAAVVLGAAADLVPIVIAALAGVVAMFATDVVSPGDAYAAVNWNVIFLLAGVIPLGTALSRSGGAAFIASLVADAAFLVPPILVLGLFYVLTGLLSNVITPVATVVLLAPVAVDTAGQIGANGFAFLLAVLFAASTAFMTPVGYQTNLMVYGPGGYRFADYVRVGAPLQLLLAVVTTVGIAVFWGV